MRPQTFLKEDHALSPVRSAGDFAGCGLVAPRFAAVAALCKAGGAFGGGLPVTLIACFLGAGGAAEVLDGKPSMPCLSCGKAVRP